MGGWDWSKMAVELGGGSQEWGGGVGFIMGDGKFLKSLYIVDRGMLNLYFMKTPLYCLPPPLPCHFKPPIPMFFLLSCFFDRMADRTTLDVLFYLMIIWIYTCSALVPYYQKDLDMCFMQKASSLLRSETCFFTGTLIWYHTHKHTQHTLRPVDWHAHIIYIYTTCYMLTAATSIRLNDYFPQCLFFSKIIQL